MSDESDASAKELADAIGRALKPSFDTIRETFKDVQEDMGRVAENFSNLEKVINERLGKLLYLSPKDLFSYLRDTWLNLFQGEDKNSKKGNRHSRFANSHNQ